MIDVGDVYSTSVTVYDAAGTPADAGAVFCTVTAPDGTVSSLHVLHESPGLYRAGVLASAAGTWQVNWRATGVNESAHDETFNVRDPAAFPVISLADVRAHLNITDTTADDELRRIVDVASSTGEAWTGRVFGRRTCVDVLSGSGPFLALKACPVLSVSSVTENGAAVPVGGYALTSPEGGVLSRVSGWSARDWARGSGNVTVTYVAGYHVQPPTDVQGALEMARHLWQTQRGSIRARANNDPGMMATFSVPLRVQELWNQNLMGSL